MNDIEDNKVVYLRIDDIIPNRFQPREMFDETGLEELSDSIKEHGVIQPIIVRKLGDKYELIAGERRTKASALAGLTTIPAIIREMDDKESAKVSLLENLQRKNLSAIEEARTYKRIIELENMTQEELARTMGRSQPMVANKLRLLSLPEEVQEALMKNQISERHARSLLTLGDKKNQLMFLDRIRNERLTVRELDAELKKFKNDNNENKERFMNNNFGNFGGMGLNDYQSGVNSNVFNNIPNNFNNIATTNEQINNVQTTNNYESFENNNSFNNQNIPTMENNGMNLGTNNVFSNEGPSSLGSIFDGGKQQSTYNKAFNSSNESNVFMSQIREDNLPKKENQFLPNFEEDETNSLGNEMNNSFPTNDNFSINNSYPINNNMPQNENNYMGIGAPSSMNYNVNNFNQPSMQQTPVTPNQYNQPMSNYNEPLNNVPNNNQFNGMNNNPIANDMYNVNNLYNPNMMNENYNTYQAPMNQMSMEQTPYNYQAPIENPMPYEKTEPMYDQSNVIGQEIPNVTQPINNDYPMNSVENYNNYNQQNDYRIPDYATQSVYTAKPNDGNLFNQPLNIVGPYGGSQEQPIEPPKPMEPVVSQEVTPNYEMPAVNIEMPNELAKDIPLPEEPKEMENPEVKEEVKEPEEAAPLPDIEIIGDNDTPLPETKAAEEMDDIESRENKVDENIQEEKPDEYIHLEDEITMHNAYDAVLELKKTTDKIKKNHLDIETEEIDFDDVYQITIKIKKTEN